MKRIAFLVIISFLFFCSNVAFAEDILSIKMVVYKNNSIDFKGMMLIHGLSTPYVQSGNYTLSFLSEYNKTIFELPIDVSFNLSTEPPISLNSSNIFLRIPFNPFMKYIKLSYNKEILFKALIKKCELNELCELENIEYSKIKQDKDNKGENSILIFLIIAIAILSVFFTIIFYRKKKQTNRNKHLA